MHGSALSLECEVNPASTEFIRWNIVTDSDGKVTLYTLNNADKVKNSINDLDARYGRKILVTNDKDNGKFTLIYESAERIRDEQTFTCQDGSTDTSVPVTVRVYCKLLIIC